MLLAAPQDVDSADYVLPAVLRMPVRFGTTKAGGACESLGSTTRERDCVSTPRANLAAAMVAYKFYLTVSGWQVKADSAEKIVLQRSSRGRVCETVTMAPFAPTELMGDAKPEDPAALLFGYTPNGECIP